METRYLCFLLAVCFSIVTVMVYHFATNHEIISKQTIKEDEYNESQITKMISTTIRSNEWIGYRLGDMLKHPKKRIKASGYQYHKSHFPNSLAVQYMDEIAQNEQGFNMTILLNIMKQRKQLYPSNDSLVIHLRIGDILENVKYLTTDFNAYKILNSPEKVFEYFLPNISANNITQVVLVTGFHKQSNDHTKSIDYIIKSKKWFETNNISVSLRINENPDDDFMFMCNSKYFMQNVHGFSGLIGRIVRLRNGTVFTANQVDAISSISVAPMQNSTNNIKTNTSQQFEENTMRNRSILKHKAHNPHLRAINDSLFCPLISQSNVDTYSKPLEYISNLQFNDSNNNTDNNKYMIVEDFPGYGLFSKLSFDVTLFTLAMALNRQYLVYRNMNENWPWLKHNNGKTLYDICQNRTGRDCVFKPFSNLKQEQVHFVLDQNDKSNSVYYFNRSKSDICNVVSIENAVQKWLKLTENFKVIYFSYQAVSSAFQSGCTVFSQHREAISYWLQNDTNWKITFYDFIALSWSYLLRLQNNIRALIDTKLTILLDKYHWISPQQTISIPLRRSDKCISEMKCASLDLWKQIIHKILWGNSEITHIIITSETKETINKTKTQFHFENIEKIYNDFDIQPDNGNTQQLQNSFGKDRGIVNSLLSMLTTFKLQMHASYYVIQKQSNWLHGIWVMSSSFDCEINQNVYGLNKQIKTLKRCINIQSYRLTEAVIQWDTSECYRKTSNVITFKTK
eukprot:164754_1